MNDVAFWFFAVGMICAALAGFVARDTEFDRCGELTPEDARRTRQVIAGALFALAFVLEAVAIALFAFGFGRST